MTTVSIPSGIQIVSSSFGLQSNTRAFTSPLNGNVQTLEVTGARWTASYQLAPNNRAGIADIQGFLMQLRGMANRFNAYDPDAKTPRGTASSTPGTPLVNGASQTGNTLNVDGMPLSATGYLLVGDYFSVNSELKMITSQVDTNGSGEATFTFEPPLRDSPANNAAVTVSNATVAMMLVNDGQAKWQANQNSIYTVGFSGIEVY